MKQQNIKTPISVGCVTEGKTSKRCIYIFIKYKYINTYFKSIYKYIYISTSQNMEFFLILLWLYSKRMSCWILSVLSKESTVLQDNPRHQKHQILGLQSDMMVHIWNFSAGNTNMGRFWVWSQGLWRKKGGEKGWEGVSVYHSGTEQHSRYCRLTRPCRSMLVLQGHMREMRVSTCGHTHWHSDLEVRLCLLVREQDWGLTQTS